jgi:hypothetical protein
VGGDFSLADSRNVEALSVPMLGRVGAGFSVQRNPRLPCDDAIDLVCQLASRPRPLSIAQNRNSCGVQSPHCEAFAQD